MADKHPIVYDRGKKVDRFFLMTEDVLGDFKQPPPGVSQGDRSPAAVKQLYTELLFQCLDLPGNRRLADIQHLRRGGKTAFAGYGVE